MRSLSLILMLALYGCKDDVAVTDDSAIPEDDTSNPDDSATDDSANPDRDGDGSPNDEDCAPDDASIHPGASEVCDGQDNDCNGQVDDGVPNSPTWYPDADHDGYGADTGSVVACQAPSADYAPLGGDCDDTDPRYNPAALESDCNDPNDYNCDGSVGFADDDNDGFAACEECDDGDPAIHPGATEVCDGVDNDCDGGVDGPNSADAIVFYVDGDVDGYGDPGLPIYDCEAPPGAVVNDGDCDDSDATVNPDAEEVCDGVDNNCDGSTDGPDASGSATWYADNDRDGYGDPNSATTTCSAPSGSVADGTDCDDTAYNINPGASEVCDSIDNNCDGSTDGADSIDGTTWYADADGDSYGDPNNSLVACSRPSGYRSNFRDCDDTDASINRGATEYCDGVDNDCDSTVDESGAADAQTWYADVDQDGYGDSGTAYHECYQPSGTVTRNDDCEDGDASINPAADDVCDGIDNDCDNVIDPTGVDTDGDGTDNCLDSTVYSYDYNDNAWTGWSYASIGGGNVPSWSMSGGRLHEQSNSALSVAYGPDLGELENYTISVDIMSNGAASDEGGIVFAMTSTADFYLASWRDPNDYYGTYTNGGSVQLSRWVSGVRTVLATDSGASALYVGYGTFITLSVQVVGPDVSISYNGTTVTTYSGTTSPLGADTIGVFTSDNDGGIYYDNFAVTNP